jgi:hypothetical protein
MSLEKKLSWSLVVLLAIIVICSAALAYLAGDIEIFKYVVTAVLSFLAGLGTGIITTWYALKGGGG